MKELTIEEFKSLLESAFEAGQTFKNEGFEYWYSQCFLEAVRQSNRKLNK